MESAARKEYTERRLELQRQLASGEITLADFMNKDTAALLAALPGLTPDEAIAVRDNTGNLLYAVEKNAAQSGLQTNPGNNPLKPN